MPDMIKSCKVRKNSSGQIVAFSVELKIMVRGKEETVIHTHPRESAYPLDANNETIDTLVAAGVISSDKTTLIRSGFEAFERLHFAAERTRRTAESDINTSTVVTDAAP